MPEALSVLYLHGFASGPESRKAGFFREKLEALGYRVVIPDLTEGNFTDLTISGQLQLIERVIAGQPVILIGSSLGGYLAALYAARHPAVERLVLLAPAFGFRELWLSELGPQRMEEWRQAGTIPVFHYGAGREIDLAYRFIEDAGKYEAFPDVRQPALIFHGKLDTTVPVGRSQAFVRHNRQAELFEVESGHELIDVLDSIWLKTEKFLSSAEQRRN